MWLDLANWYGSVPYQLMALTLDFSYILNNIKAMVMNYFQDPRICVALQKFTTDWQQSEVGIARGCSISPIIFLAQFEVMLIGARQVVGRV